MNCVFLLNYVMAGCVCASFIWGRDGTWMHNGKKASRPRQCDALGNVPLETMDPGIHVNVTLTSYTATVISVISRKVLLLKCTILVNHQQV